MVKAMAARESTQDRLDMHEYGQHDKVIVDVITLDSEACAPCQYMVDAVRRIAPEFEGIVEWREHKIKYRESLVFMSSLMVRNVPTICIDGQITFVSRIPPRDELIAAIQRRINEKFRLQLQRRRDTVYVLGADGEDASALADTVGRAVTEIGADVETVRVTDPEQFARFGLVASQTPAVVTARYQVRSVRRLPEPAAVREWIKDLQ